MPRPTALLVCLVLCVVSASPARACSAFAVADPDETWLAKNFDWHFDGGYLLKNPAGQQRRALPLHGGEPVAWTSAYGSLTFTQYGVGLPYGGINERGLAIEMLWLDETVYPSAPARALGELEWIQYQLDMRASVAEVVHAADEFAIHAVGGKIHYIVADAGGDRAIIEFIDGTASVREASPQPLVCTNDTQQLSELAFAALGAQPLKGNSSRVRYARLRRDLDATTTPASLDTVTTTLDSVRERGKPYRTQWSAIYELRKRRIHIRPDGAARAFTVDAATLDYAPASGTAFLDLFGKRAASATFAPLTAKAQWPLLARNLPKIGLNLQLQAISGHLLAPAASAVRPLEDRATLHVRVLAAAPGGFARIAVFANAGELAAQTASHAGSVLLTSAGREFAFYNLPKGRYVVGAFHDANQNGRHDPGEPLAFHRPDPAATGSDFDSLAFTLDAAWQSVALDIR